MLDLQRNNLDRAISPYLQQHRNQPIWWQEWLPEVLEAARRLDKPLFLSIGYATCHWCHVMAAEAFADPATALFLNEHWISIKIDRELRPDIDQVMMQFLITQQGSGGWPLNVFLTPDQRPIYALMYAPARRTGQTTSFHTIASQVLDYYRSHRPAIQPFQHREPLPAPVPEADLVRRILVFSDPAHGGFGRGPKFPPHTTLLFLLYTQAGQPQPAIVAACRQTLDQMRRGGLHDHLQGGLFRYCVDDQWTVPHFEKMLSDQSLALWVYALACRVLGDRRDRWMAEGIVRCLEESFALDGLYITAHDADTEHHEGATYLWHFRDLQALLTPGELACLQTIYDLPPQGNHEGQIHLIRRVDEPDSAASGSAEAAGVQNADIRVVEDKLLAIRRQRAQPQRDDKILSGLNALTATALIQAARLLDRPAWETRAASLVSQLLDRFWDESNQVFYHAWRQGLRQAETFLFDAASILTAVSLLAETDPVWLPWLPRLSMAVAAFRQDSAWLEARTADLQPVPAAWFDHPVPAAVSLAELGLARAALLLDHPVSPADYRQPWQLDFYNLAMMLRNGQFHIITSRNPLAWTELPVQVLQRRGEPETDCFQGVCRRWPPAG